MLLFNVLAALLALLMLARHGRRALGLFLPAGGEAPGGRAAALVPLLNCAIAGAVLWVSVKGLVLALMKSSGGAP
ncbi:MAG TPA: hypothetical protein VFP50_19565 [Anaeromyxobacteraceae bacterium]|nr:hypothetical protein [Anaeromyxobacteraceae bacterium]